MHELAEMAHTRRVEHDGYITMQLANYDFDLGLWSTREPVRKRSKK